MIEAVKHAAYYFKIKPEIVWLDAEVYEKSEKLKELSDFGGIIIPGGLAAAELKVKFPLSNICAPKNSVLGICYGMQLAVVEFSRSIAGLKKPILRKLIVKRHFQ